MNLMKMNSKKILKMNFVRKSSLKSWKNGVKQTFFEADKNNWYACGICCLLHALKKLGSKKSIEKLLSEIEDVVDFRRVRESGLSIREMEDCFLHFGVLGSLRSYKNQRVESFFFDLVEHLKNNSPVIVFPGMHAISVIYIDNTRVYFMAR